MTDTRTPATGQYALGSFDPETGTFYPYNTTIISARVSVDAYLRAFYGYLPADPVNLEYLSVHDTYPVISQSTVLHPNQQTDSLTVTRFECPALYDGQDAHLLHKDYEVFLVIRQIRDSKQADVQLVAVVNGVGIDLRSYLKLIDSERRIEQCAEQVRRLTLKLRSYALHFMASHHDELDSLDYDD